MKLKLLVCAAILGTLAFGAAKIAGYQGVADPKRNKAQPDPVEENFSRLGRARLEAAEKAYKDWFKGLRMPPSDTLYHLSVRWLAAELDAASKPGDRLAAHISHRERMVCWGKELKEHGVPEESA